MLRPYQKKVIGDTYQQIKGGKRRILIFAPTGAGKTIIASQIAAHAVSRGRHVMFIVHRDILVKQTYNKVQQFGLNCGFIKARWSENRTALMQIASAQTMVKRDWWHDYPVDVVIIDEAHLTGFSKVVRRMMDEIQPNALYLGLSATPWRLSKTEGMGDLFEAIALAPLPCQLIEQGYLVKPSYYGIDLADLREVRTDKEGEFDEFELALATDTPEFVSRVVSEWFQRAHRRRTIAFTANVKHSQHLCQAFLAQGVPAAHVDGNTPTAERDRLYQQLGDGEILVLCNCQTLIEGFDIPATEVLLGCRGTHSKALHFQMLGRVLRPCERTGKIQALVLDFVGNLQRHGFVEDIREIALEAGFQPSEGIPPKKLCPVDEGGCGAVLYALQKVCPHCHYSFESRKLTVTLKLKQMLRPEDVERLRFYREKLKEAFEYQYAPSWAANVFKEAYGYYPPFDWGTGAVFGLSPPTEAEVAYRRHLEAIAQRLSKNAQWIQRYLKMEFELIN